jgi:hypothetical protein
MHMLSIVAARRGTIDPLKRASIQDFVSGLADLPVPIRISQSELLGNKGSLGATTVRCDLSGADFFETTLGSRQTPHEMRD